MRPGRRNWHLGHSYSYEDEIRKITTSDTINFLKTKKSGVKYPINFKFNRCSSVRDEKRVFKTSSRQLWCNARMTVKLFLLNIFQVLKPSLRAIFQKIGSQEAITRSKHMFIGKELFKTLLKWGRESVFRTYKQRQNRFFAQIN